MKRNGLKIGLVLVLLVFLAVFTAGVYFPAVAQAETNYNYFTVVEQLPKSIYRGKGSITTGELENSILLAKYWESTGRIFKDSGIEVVEEKHQVWETTYDKSILGYGGSNKAHLLGPLNIDKPSRVCYHILDLNPPPDERKFEFFFDSQNGVLDPTNTSFEVMASGELVDNGCFEVDGGMELWAWVEDSSGPLLSIEEIFPPTSTPEPTPTATPSPTQVPVEPTPTQVHVEPTPTQVHVEPTPTQVPMEPTPTQVHVEPTPTQVPMEPTPTQVPVDPTPVPFYGKVFFPLIFVEAKAPPEEPSPSVDLTIKLSGEKGVFSVGSIKKDEDSGEWSLDVKGLSFVSFTWNQEIPAFYIFDGEVKPLHDGKYSGFSKGEHRFVFGDEKDPIFAITFNVIEVEKPESFGEYEEEILEFMFD